MKNNEGRVVVWFSCGAASAVAAKLAADRYENLKVVYCDTLKSEHPDNARFLRDVEAWINHKVTIIKSKKYADIDDVFEKRQYMAGIAGAPCTREMKKIPRLDFQQPGDLHIFGLTADEQTRIKRFEANNPDIDMDWILRDAGFSKDDCYTAIQDAGVALPVMYSLGFNNNNCLGCVKATSPKYWSKVRRHFPLVFQKRAEQSRRIGARLARVDGKRIFLDELPFSIEDLPGPDEDIECGVICVRGEDAA